MGVLAADLLLVPPLLSLADKFFFSSDGFFLRFGESSIVSAAFCMRRSRFATGSRIELVRNILNVSASAVDRAASRSVIVYPLPWLCAARSLSAGTLRAMRSSLLRKAVVKESQVSSGIAMLSTSSSERSERRSATQRVAGRLSSRVLRM